MSVADSILYGEHCRQLSTRPGADEFDVSTARIWAASNPVEFLQYCQNNFQEYLCEFSKQMLETAQEGQGLGELSPVVMRQEIKDADQFPKWAPSLLFDFKWEHKADPGQLHIEYQELVFDDAHLQLIEQLVQYLNDQPMLHAQDFCLPNDLPVY